MSQKKGATRITTRDVSMKHRYTMFSCERFQIVNKVPLVPSLDGPGQMLVMQLLGSYLLFQKAFLPGINKNFFRKIRA